VLADAAVPAPVTDPEERKVRAMINGLRQGLRDPATRPHLAQLIRAAMGDERSEPNAAAHERASEQDAVVTA